jgi:MoaD family protein
VIVSVHGYLTFRDLVGKRQVEIEPGATLAALLERLSADLGGKFTSRVFDAEGNLRRQVAVLVNGRHHTHTEEGLGLCLHPGDEVAIFPPIAGG